MTLFSRSDQFMGAAKARCEITRGSGVRPILVYTNAGDQWTRRLTNIYLVASCQGLGVKDSKVEVGLDAEGQPIKVSIREIFNHVTEWGKDLTHHPWSILYDDGTFCSPDAPQPVIVIPDDFYGDIR